MNRKWMYIGAVILLLLAVLMIPKDQEVEGERVWQHEAAVNQLEDTSLSIDPETFSSHLPVISIETGGREIPGRADAEHDPSEIENTFIQADMRIINQQEQLNTLASQAETTSKINIRVRGNSSRYYEKPGYLFKFVDGEGSPSKHEVLGMEQSSTWILTASYIDKTQMRNYMWYNLAGEMMEWAPDVRFCEVFVDQEYQGLYVVTEQIDVGEGRLQLTEATSDWTKTSYLLELDRQEINASGIVDSFSKSAGLLADSQQITVQYPGKNSLTPEQLVEITRDFSRFEKSLYSYDYASEKYGYPSWIDEDSFVDYYIINEVTRNLDAGRYSTFIYKDVRGKFKLCVWDFDNCCNNYIVDPFETTGFLMKDRVWFEMLCKDKDFVRHVISRYRQLRKGVLSDEMLEQRIVEIEQYLGCAITRNYRKWGRVFTAEGDDFVRVGRPITSYGEALEQYRSSLFGRLEWLDENIDTMYRYCHKSVNKKYNH